MYVIIPLKETIDITRTQLKNYNTQTTNQFINLLEDTLRQNYFVFQEQIYQPEKGVAMGSPISGTMTEIFIHLEDFFIKHHLDSKSITFYSRYVDNILIIYDYSYMNPNAVTQYANTIHNKLQINTTPENAGQISFLDLTITRKTTNLEIDIFRKPTTTNTTISYLSNHPLEHKLAAYHYYIERKFSLPLNKGHQLIEWTTILDTAKSNFPDNILISLIQQKITHRIQKQHQVDDIHIRRLSKKYPTLNFPAHSNDARAAPLCTAEGDSLMRMLEFFLRVRVCQLLPAGRRVRCCYACSSDL